jgi:chemotaxis protein CheD
MDNHYLYPGNVFCSKTPHLVRTVLGSCVAVFLWDPALRFASINHYMLPGKAGSASFKYGDVATAELIRRMLHMGSKKSNLRAKIFGGSEIARANGVFNIGGRNIALAQEMLKGEGIPITSYSVGGHVGRRVIFYTGSGEVLISFIKQEMILAEPPKNDFEFNLSGKWTKK